MEAIRKRKVASQWDVIAMYCVAFCAFAFSNLSVLWGPILLLLMIFCVTHNKVLPCIALVFVGNDALGTILLGKGSFDFALFALLIVYLIWNEKNLYKSKSVFFICCSILLCLYMIFFDKDVASDLVVTTFFNCFFAFIVYEECAGNGENTSIFFRYLGLACFLVAAVMAFIGGKQTVEYVYDGNIRIETFRTGLLGAGSGDPNFSGLRLLLGTVCIFYAKELGKWRWLMLFIFVIAMVKTLSVTLLLIASLLITFGVLLYKGVRGRIKGVLTILLIVFIIAYIFVVIPSDKLPESVNMFRLRVLEKAESLVSGNINEFTTNRTNMSVRGLDNFAQGNVLQQLFGFNSIFCHNTYIDSLNRFGIVGFFSFIFIIIKNMLRALKNKDTANGKRIVLIKLLYVAFSFTLTIYSGVEVSFLMLFLLVI